MKSYFIAAMFLLVVGCSSNTPKKYLVPKDTVFKNDTKTISTFLGNWESVYSYEDKKNIQNLELKSDGTANVTIIHNGKQSKYSGQFFIAHYERIQIKSAIKIVTKDSEVILLSNVYFGLHCGTSIPEDGVILRVDDEPCGVFKKIN